MLTTERIITKKTKITSLTISILLLGLVLLAVYNVAKPSKESEIITKIHSCEILTLEEKSFICPRLKEKYPEVEDCDELIAMEWGTYCLGIYEKRVNNSTLKESPEFVIGSTFKRVEEENKKLIMVKLYVLCYENWSKLKNLNNYIISTQLQEFKEIVITPENLFHIVILHKLVPGLNRKSIFKSLNYNHEIDHIIYDINHVFNYLTTPVEKVILSNPQLNRKYNRLNYRLRIKIENNYYVIYLEESEYHNVYLIRSYYPSPYDVPRIIKKNNLDSFNLTHNLKLYEKP